MAEQQVLTKWCLFWGSGSKHASKISTQKKIDIPPYKNLRAAKSWLMHTALPFCVEFFLLAPIHFVGFLQDPAVYSYSTIAYNSGVWSLGVNFKEDDFKGDISYLYIFIMLYHTWCWCRVVIVKLARHQSWLSTSWGSLRAPTEAHCLRG